MITAFVKKAIAACLRLVPVLLNMHVPPQDDFNARLPGVYAGAAVKKKASGFAEKLLLNKVI